MDELIVPVPTEGGIKVMSANLVLENETDPVLWRGPVIAGAIKQFWEDTAWGELDYLLVDMPPGTSDVALTVFQSLPRGRRGDRELARRTSCRWSSARP